MAARNLRKSLNIHRAIRHRLRVEELEARTLLSAGLDALFAVPAAGPFVTNPTPVGYTPSQIRYAYGIDQLAGNGSGQTIAIVDAYDDPNIASDVDFFNQTFGLPRFNQSGGPTFTKVNQTGGTKYPKVNSGWAGEISLDVEWAHAVAPGANILLVEATTNSFTNLLTAVDYASSHASVVSMSWGSNEFSGETTYDAHFLHSGVTFVASSGDNGAPPEWPAISPNVVAVGGTTLRLNPDNSWNSETGWAGSGGGYSSFEIEPGYQTSVQSSGVRTNPDVGYNADPNTGFAVYDTVRYYGQTGWFQAGGTSAGAPQWAGLVALANQSRVAAGKSTLDGVGQTLPTLYSVSAGDFHDVTFGNNGYSAGPGYDLVTGRGTPYANLVVADLAATTLGGAASPFLKQAATAGGRKNTTSHVTAPVTGNTTSTGDKTPLTQVSTSQSFVIVLSNNPAAAPVVPSGAVTTSISVAPLPVSVVPTAAAPSVASIVSPVLSGGDALPPAANNDASQQWQPYDPVFDEECIPDRVPGQSDTTLDQAGLPWEEVRDICFAGVTWSAADAGCGAAAAAERLGQPVDRFLAMAAGLVGLTGSYWSASEESEKRRTNRTA